MEQLTELETYTRSLSPDAFPLMVERVVEQVLSSESSAQVKYGLAKLMGIKHLVPMERLADTQIDAIRESMNRLWKESYLWQWAIEKPYGYAGDYVALEMLYDNSEHPASSQIGRWLDRWLLDSQLALGVRERKDILSAFIESLSSAHYQAFGQKLRILSVASGSARELRDLKTSTLNQMDVTMIDVDQRPLDFAANHLPADFSCLKANALRLKSEMFSGSFDLIYSFGFFDYLKDQTIIKTLSTFKENLNDGGSILFPLKIDSKFRHWFYDVCLDWRFIKREIKDGFKLASQAGLEVVELYETENESVVFFHCVAMS